MHFLCCLHAVLLDFSVKINNRVFDRAAGPWLAPPAVIFPPGQLIPHFYEPSITKPPIYIHTRACANPHKMLVLSINTELRHPTRSTR